VRFRAFTLVEMLVALAVTSVLTVLMLRMFTDSSTIWKREDERLDTFREARAALQLIASELSSVNPVSGVSPVAGGPEQFPLFALRIHPDTPAPDQAISGNHQIYALAAVPNRGKSDLCAIGYFCHWDDAKSCFILRRQFADSDTTFTRLQQVLKPSGLLQDPAAFNLLYSRAAASGSAAVEPVQDVASYVWDLQFALPAPTPTSTPPPWPQGLAARELPLWVEIRFKALGASAARKLEAQSFSRQTWFETTRPAYQRFILPGEQQFVTRVKLSR
jgi:prepilin-type N-terminal cleavage/methylation domain-containing protein